MDIQKAHIITLTEKGEVRQTLFSEVENYRPSGGSGTKLKGGPQDVVQDSKYSERKKHQIKRYFNTLAELVKDAEAIIIFGPADTATKFRKELNDNHRLLAAKVRSVIKVDSMTDNQVKAMVRDYFKSKN